MGYPIRPLSVGEILDTGFRLLRDHWRLLLGITLLLWLPTRLVERAVDAALRAAFPATPGTFSSFLSLYPGMLFDAALYAPYAAAMAIAGAGAYLGRPAGVAQTLRQTRAILLPCIIAEVLSTTLVMAGLLLLIVPGVVLMLNYALTTQVVTLEGCSGREALRRSRELMVGKRVRLLVVSTAAGVLVVLLHQGATWVLQGLPSVRQLALEATGTITGAFVEMVLVVFYVDVLCRREAFDIEHLAQQVEAASAAAAMR